MSDIDVDGGTPPSILCDPRTPKGAGRSGSLCNLLGEAPEPPGLLTPPRPRLEGGDRGGFSGRTGAVSHEATSALRGDDSRPLFAFAGVWRRYKGPIKKDGPSVELEVYSFLTTTPNPLVETINHERMPVLLTTEDEFATWLNGTPTEAMSLARQYPPECMRIVQEGFTKQDMLEAA